MTTSQEVLIQVTDLHKVFVTEEVETHALSGVHLEIHRDEYIAIAGPSPRKTPLYTRLPSLSAL